MKMEKIAAIAAIGALLAISHWASSAAHSNDATYPLTKVRGGRLTIAARINGHAVTALLDSAAEATIIDSAWARGLNLEDGQGVSGQGSGSSSFDAKLVKGVTLQAVGLRLENQTVAVTDLSDVGRRLLHKHIVAILGREIFDAARLSIDIEGGHISVAGRDHVPRGVRLHLLTEHGLETIPVRVESGDPVRATFDLGNGAHVLIGAALAERMRFLSDGRTVKTERGGGLGGETERQVFRLHTLEIAGRKFTDVEAALDQNASASDVNIGVSVLRHFRITTDFANHVVWLDPRR
jgi:Aspartyl protease